MRCGCARSLIICINYDRAWTDKFGQRWSISLLFLSQFSAPVYRTLSEPGSGRQPTHLTPPAVTALSMMPLTSCNGPTSREEIALQTMTDPPTCLTVGIWYRESYLVFFGRRAYFFPSLPNRLNFDSSEKVLYSTALEFSVGTFVQISTGPSDFSWWSKVFWHRRVKTVLHHADDK